MTRRKTVEWSVPMLRVAGTTGTVQWLCLTFARSDPTPHSTLSPQVCVQFVCVNIFGLWFSHKCTEQCYRCLHLYFKWLNMTWFISEVNLVWPSHAIWVSCPKIACFQQAEKFLAFRVCWCTWKSGLVLRISPVSVCETDSWADDGRYQCDVGWQNFQAGCYRLNSDNLDWSSAHKMCQKMEANLVSIHTLPELEFITKHMKKGIHMQINAYS